MSETYIYIAVMAIVTYLIRVLPLTLIRREIKNVTLRSFLYYVPYVVLSALSFPAIFVATDSFLAGFLAAFICGFLAYKGKSLIVCMLGSVVTVVVVDALLLLVH